MTTTAKQIIIYSWLTLFGVLVSRLLWLVGAILTLIAIAHHYIILFAVICIGLGLVTAMLSTHWKSVLEFYSRQYLTELAQLLQSEKTLEEQALED